MRIGEKNCGVIKPKISEQKKHLKNNSIEAILMFLVYLDSAIFFTDHHYLWYKA